MFTCNFLAKLVKHRMKKGRKKSYAIDKRFSLGPPIKKQNQPTRALTLLSLHLSDINEINLKVLVGFLWDYPWWNKSLHATTCPNTRRGGHQATHNFNMVSRMSGRFKWMSHSWIILHDTSKVFISRKEHIRCLWNINKRSHKPKQRWVIIDKPESKSQSKVQALNPKESNSKRERRIWTLGCP